MPTKKQTSPVSTQSNKPRLFGIADSNRPPDKMWGKNCFNSAFPTALACYMWARGIRPVYVHAAADNGNLSVQNSEIGVDMIFGAPANVGSERLRFEFETRFEPYIRHVQNPAEVDGADLVVKHADQWLRPLQIKLTVVPDDGTSGESRENWGPELVLRPADSCACALGIFHRIADRAAEVEEIFRRPCADIQDWNNRTEIGVKRDELFDCVERFLSAFHGGQRPYLLQPIWMTEGKKPFLADNAFDIFAWSDFALAAAYLFQAKKEGEINRATRAVVRFARAQYELATLGKIRIRRIYREMDFGRQTDKEVAMSGKMSRRYMTSPRRVSPILPPEALSEIILNGGHKMLSPERRFDQTVYFTAEKYFSK